MKRKRTKILGIKLAAFVVLACFSLTSFTWTVPDVFAIPAKSPGTGLLKLENKIWLASAASLGERDVFSPTEELGERWLEDSESYRSRLDSGLRALSAKNVLTAAEASSLGELFDGLAGISPDPNDRKSLNRSEEDLANLTEKIKTAQARSAGEEPEPEPVGHREADMTTEQVAEFVKGASLEELINMEQRMRIKLLRTQDKLNFRRSDELSRSTVQTQSFGLGEGASAVAEIEAERNPDKDGWFLRIVTKPNANKYDESEGKWSTELERYKWMVVRLSAIRAAMRDNAYARKNGLPRIFPIYEISGDKLSIYPEEVFTFDKALMKEFIAANDPDLSVKSRNAHQENVRRMIEDYINVIAELISRGWYTPDIKWNNLGYNKDGLLLLFDIGELVRIPGAESKYEIPEAVLERLLRMPRAGKPRNRKMCVLADFDKLESKTRRYETQMLDYERLEDDERERTNPPKLIIEPDDRPRLADPAYVLVALVQNFSIMADELRSKWSVESDEYGELWKDDGAAYALCDVICEKFKELGLIDDANLHAKKIVSFGELQDNGFQDFITRASSELKLPPSVRTIPVSLLTIIRERLRLPRQLTRRYKSHYFIRFLSKVFFTRNGAGGEAKRLWDNLEGILKDIFERTNVEDERQRRLNNMRRRQAEISSDFDIYEVFAEIVNTNKQRLNPSGKIEPVTAQDVKDLLSTISNLSSVVDILQDELEKRVLEAGHYDPDAVLRECREIIVAIGEESPARGEMMEDIRGIWGAVRTQRFREAEDRISRVLEKIEHRMSSDEAIRKFTDLAAYLTTMKFTIACTIRYGYKAEDTREFTQKMLAAQAKAHYGKLKIRNSDSASNDSLEQIKSAIKILIEVVGKINGLLPEITDRTHLDPALQRIFLRNQYDFLNSVRRDIRELGDVVRRIAQATDQPQLRDDLESILISSGLAGNDDTTSDSGSGIGEIGEIIDLSSDRPGTGATQVNGVGGVGDDYVDISDLRSNQPPTTGRDYAVTDLDLPPPIVSSGEPDSLDELSGSEPSFVDDTGTPLEGNPSEPLFADEPAGLGELPDSESPETDAFRLDELEDGSEDGSTDGSDSGDGNSLGRVEKSRVRKLSLRHIEVCREALEKRLAELDVIEEEEARLAEIREIIDEFKISEAGRAQAAVNFVSAFARTELGIDPDANVLISLANVITDGNAALPADQVGRVLKEVAGLGKLTILYDGKVPAEVAALKNRDSGLPQILQSQLKIERVGRNETRISEAAKIIRASEGAGVVSADAKFLEDLSERSGRLVKYEAREELEFVTLAVFLLTAYMSAMPEVSPELLEQKLATIGLKKNKESGYYEVLAELAKQILTAQAAEIVTASAA